MRFATIFLFILSISGLSHAQSLTNKPKSVQEAINYCPYRYDNIADLNVIICSRDPISQNEIITLKNKIRKTYSVYSSFITEYGVSYVFPTDKVVATLMTYEEMNDSDIFVDAQHTGNILARYFPNTGTTRKNKLLYITKSSFQVADLDLPHEMVHYLNECHGISDVKKDEGIAYSFEKVYAATP